MVSPTGDNRDIEANIRLRTDQKELQKTTKDLQALRRELDATFAPDNAKIEQARRQFERHRKEVEHNARVARDVNDVYRSWGKVLGDIERQNVVKKLTSELAEATKNGKDLDATLERVKKELQAIGATEGEVRQVITGAQVTGGGRGRNTLQVVGSEIRALPAVPLGVGGLSSDVLGKVTATLGGLGPAGTAAALGIGAAIAALKASTSGIEQTVKSIIASQELYFNALKTGTKESIQSQIESQKIEIDITRARVQEYQTLFKNLEAQVGTVGRGIADALDLGGARQLREETQELENQLRALEFGLGRLEQAAKDSDVAARSAAEAEKRLAEERQQVADARIRATLAAELQVADMSGEAIQKRLDAINREQAAILSIARAGEIGDEALDQLTQRTRDLAAEAGVLADALGPAIARDALKALTELDTQTLALQEQHNERMLAVKEQGDRQLEAAEKRLREAVTRLADFEVAQSDKRTETETDFRSKEIERTRKFNRDLERMKEDSNRRLLQLGQELADSQLEATLSNDVGAFLRAQRNFDRAAALEKENLDISSRRKLEDFQEESRRNQQLLTEKLTAIDTETNKKREALQAEIAEQEAALEETKKQIAAKQAAEEAAFKKSLNELVKSFDTTTQAMTGISQQAMAILQQAGVNVAGGIVDELQRRANLLGVSSSQQYSTPSNLTRTATGVTPTVRLTGFADGTLSTRSIFGGRAAIAAVNDHPDPARDEAIIPYRRSVGLASELQRLGISGGGGGPTTYHFFEGANLAGVTQADIQRLKDILITANSMAMHAARTGVAP